MSLFDQLVDTALENQKELAALRPVLEKELLHHDVLRELSKAGLLSGLTFMGGTCLRACYGANRLSEDLDFTGGQHFNRAVLVELGQVLVRNLRIKYDLNVEVSEPTREQGYFDTWKLKIQTRPERKDLPAQRINIDVCAIPSYEPRPMLLLNPYSVDMGTSGLIVQAESRAEIFADKLIAFALRPNRIKHRDLWDMSWLHQQAIKPKIALLDRKLEDHNYPQDRYLFLLRERCELMQSQAGLAMEFRAEMRRFLPLQLVTGFTDKPEFWQMLQQLVSDLVSQVERRLSS
jgi:predicted nucleotidyltransferase component of viral defense system